MKRFVPRLSYANVVATLALFLAIGGVGYAATRLPKNSVGTRQISNGAVTGAKIKLSSLGTVPSASHADTASTDTTATTATTAATAANAQTLGGASAAQITAQAKLVCPQGMKLDIGFCFETAPSAAAGFAGAIFACSQKGRWLPTLGQLLAYEGRNYAVAPADEWSEPPAWDGSEEFAMTGTAAIGGAASFAAAAVSSSHAYRCMTAPTN